MLRTRDGWPTTAGGVRGRFGDGTHRSVSGGVCGAVMLGGDASLGVPSRRLGGVEGGPLLANDAGVGAAQEPHPKKNWPRHAEATSLAWAGDSAHEKAMDRSGWAASEGDLVEWRFQGARASAPRHCLGPQPTG